MAKSENEVSNRGTRTIALPERVASRVEDRLPRTEFESASEYVAFVVEEVLYRVENDTDGDAITGDQRAEVEKRLESLGYLDE